MIIESLDQLKVISLKIIRQINKQDCILLFGDLAIISVNVPPLSTQKFQKLSSDLICIPIY